jgi:signal transduction histidine kinase/response regulator RpfG family c-di-GMP phosphodiesterase
MDDGKVNILLVDDKPEKLLALEAVLEELDQNIIRAYSGREALRAMLKEEVALILLDVNMPGMDGFETASLIRQRKTSEHIPIIFITAYGDEMHASRGYSLGAVDYIQTPVLPEVLKTKVAVFVDLYRKTEQVRRQAESLRRRAEQLQKLAAASVAINAAPSIDKMLQVMTETARDVIGAHQGITLYIANEGGETRKAKTESFTSFSDKYADWRDRKLQLDSIANTIVAKSRTATRLTRSELLHHPDWELVNHSGIPPITGGMMAAPLFSRDSVRLGVLYLCDRYEGDFTSDDEAVLVQLAQMGSVALENALFAEERETNRIKDEFLSMLSHELRTPLNAILGWTHLLRIKPSEEEANYGIDVIERNARAQAKLIEDMLDLSRINSGKLRMTPRPIEITPVVRAAVDAILPVAEGKKVCVECVCNPPVDLGINADPDRMQQVVWNLLSNAVKFTPEEGRVEVRVEIADQRLRIRVTDTGQGINSNFLPYVFDRFRQADSTSTRAHGGLGIGLTIVRHIIEQHGGTVRADSAGEGHGSTFTVELPTISLHVESAETPALTTTQLAEGDAPDLSGKQILLVDDEPDALDVMAQLLRHAGATVTTATCVADALECAVRMRPDLIVSDIAMPDRDGYDLLRNLRELPQTSAIPAIALTAYARQEDRVRALSEGFQAHLPKPVEPNELISVIDHVARANERSRDKVSATHFN